MAKLPSVVSPVPQDVKAFINEVRQALDGRNGDKLVTANDLVSSGIAAPGPGGTITPPSGTVGTPATPKNVQASGAIQNIIVTWDDPLYNGHSHAEIWGSSTNNLGAAVQIGMAPGAIFVDAVGPSVTRYYWVRFVNVLGVVGAFNATAGVQGVTGSDVAYLLDTLTDAALDPDSDYSKFAVRADFFYVMPSPDFNQETTPTATATGDLWYQPSTELVRTWTGSTWGAFSQTLPFVVNSSPQTINGVAVPAGVYIDAAFIKNGTITTAKIGNAQIDDAKIVSLTAAKITAGEISVGNYIQSSGFITGSAGWKIGGNGVAEFAAASIRGQLIAAQINANGLSIKDTAGNIILNAGTGVFSGTTSYSNVTGLGALATQSTVSATTQVTGLGGFAFIGSITSANISTFIAGAAIGTAYISNAAITNALIVDAAITTAKIGDAQITSAKIGDAQITSAKIGDAQITNAKIGTAAVDTLTIAGQAVTVPNSAFTAGEYRNTVNATFQDAQTLTITTSGSRVYVASAGLALGGDSSEGGINPRFRLVRDSTELMQGGPSMSYSDTPSAGTYTYKLQVISDGTGTVFTYAGISNRSLFTIETKR
jgi:hypothetical protein